MIDAAPVEARFSVDQPAWHQGEEIRVRLTVANRGGSPIVVILPQPGSLRLRFDVVRGGAAETVQPAELPEEGLAAERQIAPGELVSVEYPLRQRVRLERPGRFTIHAAVRLEYRAGQPGSAWGETAPLGNDFELEVK